MGPVTPALGGVVRVNWQTVCGTHVAQGLAPSPGQWSFDGEAGPGLQSGSGSQVPGPGKAGREAPLVWKLEGFVLSRAHQPRLSSAGPPPRAGNGRQGLPPSGPLGGEPVVC